MVLVPLEIAVGPVLATSLIPNILTRSIRASIFSGGPVISMVSVSGLTSIILPRNIFAYCITSDLTFSFAV